MSPHRSFSRLFAGFVIGAQSGASKNRNASRATRECIATRATVRIESIVVVWYTQNRPPNSEHRLGCALLHRSRLINVSGKVSPTAYNNSRIYRVKKIANDVRVSVQVIINLPFFSSSLLQRNILERRPKIVVKVLLEKILF